MELKGLVYTGIGSRSTPLDWQLTITNIARSCAERGMILRSGGAMGADWAFEQGLIDVHGMKEIFIPWNNFRPDPEQPFWVRTVHEPGVYCIQSPEALKLAEHYHPYWHGLSQGSRRLMARNVHQILGADLASPTKLVIFWAPEERGEVQGGTGQAIRIARDLAIPCFNLAVAGTLARLKDFFQELRTK